MRVSSLASASAITAQIQNQQSTISLLETSLASGQAIQRPSDNPNATVTALQLQTQLGQATSWQASVSTANSWLSLANTAANSVVEGLQQARTLMVQALNQGTQSPTTYSGIAQQLSGIRSDILGLANTSFAGQPIFAGTSASSLAYDSAGNYQGSGSPPSVVVGPGPSPGQTLDMSVTGPALFGSGSSSVFSVLSKAISDLSAPGGPSTSSLHTDMANIEASLSQATTGAANLGNLSSQAETLSSALSSEVTKLQGNLGTLVSVNIPQVTTQLNSDMATYQAALWAASKAVPPSLVEYL